MKIDFYTQNSHKAISFRSYSEARTHSQPPQVLSIRNPQADSTELIDFLQQYHSPPPQVVLAYKPNQLTALQLLINHFCIFRVLPPQCTDEELRQVSEKALHLYKRIWHPSSNKPQGGASFSPQRITASTLAHELNNPLGGMTSFIKLIRMESLPEKAHHEDLIKMEEEGQKCQKLVKDFLSFVKN